MISFLAAASASGNATDVRRWADAIDGVAGDGRKARVESTGREFVAVAWGAPPHDDESIAAWTTSRASGVLGVGLARIADRNTLAAAVGVDAGASVSDLDIIALAYKKWGDGFAARIDGDFTVVLWDKRERRVVAVRDPFGSVPLLYVEKHDALVLSTDAEPLLRLLGSTPPIDERMVLDYLLRDFRGRSRTFFVGVERAIPGHTMVAQRGRRDLLRFWYPPQHEVRLPRDEVLVRYRELLRRSTARQMRGARRLAVDLSGGLDSSSIAALVVQLARKSADSERPYRLWHMAFPGSAADEAAYTDAMEAHLGVPAHRVPMTGDVDPVLAKSLAAWPPGRSDLFDEYYDSLRADGSDVVLGGEGGDSLNFEAAVMADLAADRNWRALARELIPLPTYQSMGWRFWAKVVLGGLAPPRVRAIRRRLARRPRMPTWLGSSLRTAWRERCDEIVSSSQQIENEYVSNIQRSTWQSLTNPTLEWILDSLRWVFRKMGMEVRYPFLDPALARFVLSLPPSQRLPHGNMRHLQRDAMGTILPPLVRNRTQPTYFDSYIESGITLMIRNLQPALSSRSWQSEPYVRREAFVKSLTGRPHAGSELSLLTVWQVVTLELWLKRTEGAQTRIAGTN